MSFNQIYWYFFCIEKFLLEFRGTGSFWSVRFNYKPGYKPSTGKSDWSIWPVNFMLKLFGNNMDGPLDPEDPLKPLHRCNFYGSKEAGNKLDSMLKLGASKPWKDAMEVRNMFALLLFYYDIKQEFTLILY